jgi:peptidoglycan/xylan/chitin deacetylase (PgdA/CDA1 family)
MPLPLTILVYRRVLAQPDPLFPERLDAGDFARQVRQLARLFAVLPLASAVQRLHDGTLPRRSACITVDGGYAETAGVAAAVLQQHAVPATFFIASGMLDGGYCWRDAVVDLVRTAPGPRLDLGAGGLGRHDIGGALERRALIETLTGALAALPMLERIERLRAMARSSAPTRLDADQVLALHRAGFAIGAHPVNDTPMATLSNFDARQDLVRGRVRLEDIVQAPVCLFADASDAAGSGIDQRHANMLRSAGFAAAVTTLAGAAGPATDRFALPRHMPSSCSAARFLWQLAHNLLAPVRTHPTSLLHWPT